MPPCDACAMKDFRGSPPPPLQARRRVLRSCGIPICHARRLQRCTLRRRNAPEEGHRPHCPRPAATTAAASVLHAGACLTFAAPRPHELVDRDSRVSPPIRAGCIHLLPARCLRLRPSAGTPAACRLHFASLANAWPPAPIASRGTFLCWLLLRPRAVRGCSRLSPPTLRRVSLCFCPPISFRVVPCFLLRYCQAFVLVLGCNCCNKLTIVPTSGRKRATHCHHTSSQLAARYGASSSMLRGRPTVPRPRQRPRFRW